MEVVCSMCRSPDVSFWGGKQEGPFYCEDCFIRRYRLRCHSCSAPVCIRHNMLFWCKRCFMQANRPESYTPYQSPTKTPPVFVKVPAATATASCDMEEDAPEDFSDPRLRGFTRPSAVSFSTEGQERYGQGLWFKPK